ncbi:MAG: c-type cytochrome, partial [Vicinamibacterales bacterium]
AIDTSRLSAGERQPPAPAGQAPAPPGGPGRGGQGRGGGVPAYPNRTVDPAMAERGRALYSAQCAFCHGADTRGASGPSLLRSQLVQDDRNGETIALVIRGGRPPMPAFDFTDAQLTDLAAFLHSFALNSRDPARMRPMNIVTGDATAGQAYFAGTCGSCHSADRDLKGIAARLPDPRALQQWWLLPGGGGGRGGPIAGAKPIPPTRATITLPSGQQHEGRLARIDEFQVSIVEADGTTRTFPRDGDRPKVDIRDPLAQHKALLRFSTPTKTFMT